MIDKELKAKCIAAIAEILRRPDATESAMFALTPAYTGPWPPVWSTK